MGGREEYGPVAAGEPVDPGAVRVHAERPGADPWEASSSRWKGSPYASAAHGPPTTSASSRNPCAAPEHRTMRSGEARTPRTRAR